MIVFLFFPIEIYPGYTFDFRQVPLIIGGIYAGRKIAIVLFLFFNAINFYVGLESVLTSLIVSFIILLVMIYVIIPNYDEYSPRKKTLTCMGILFVTSLSDFLFGYTFHYELTLSKAFPMFLLYTIIQTVTVGVLISTSQYVQKNAKVQKEYHQAEKLRIISELAASVSHEVRNPLTVTRGFLQLLKNENIDKDTRNEYLDLSLQELDRAQGLITDYLTFAKPCEGSKPNKLIVREQLEYIENVMQPYALMQGVKINKVFLGEDYIIGDKHKFRQSLINLFKNSIEAMPDGGDLMITLAKSDGDSVIQIEDTGVGMTESQVARLGTPFYSSKEKGTGLGTMVAFSIIQAMEGKISVKSEKGKGTTFTIRFPLAIGFE